MYVIGIGNEFEVVVGIAFASVIAIVVADGVGLRIRLRFGSDF